MKKFLLMAGFALAATSPVLAGGGGHCCNDPREDPQCVMCEEESNKADIDICATVNVPLHLDCEDNSITFPCLYRPNYPYNPAGHGGDVTLNPANGVTQASGRLAQVDIIGDENDDIWLYVNKSYGDVTMTWLPRPGEVVDGSQSTTFNVHLLWAATYGGGIFQAPVADGPPAESFFGDFNIGGRSQGQPGNAPNPTQLGRDGGAGGTGAVHIWLGGTASPNANQQRGFYGGTFDIWADYYS